VQHPRCRHVVVEDNDVGVDDIDVFALLTNVQRYTFTVVRMLVCSETSWHSAKANEASPQTDELYFVQCATSWIIRELAPAEQGTGDRFRHWTATR
jgi:hypothetical protein